MKKRCRGPRALRWGALACLAVFLGAPLAVLARDALRGGGENLWNALTLPSALSSLVVSLRTAFLAASVNAGMGALAAWALARGSFPGRRALNALVDLPLAVPSLATGAALASLLGPRDAGGTGAITLALLVVTLPTAVRPAQSALLAADRALKRPPPLPGATAWDVFRRDPLPRLLPGIATGFSLCFSRALGEMGAVVMVAGNLPMKTQTAAVYALGELENDNRLGAAAVSLALVGASFLLSLAVERARDLFSEGRR